MKQKKTALFTSIVSLLLVVSMLAGSTFAWFTDSVVSANNVIISGDLDIQLEYLEDGNWVTVDETTNVFAEDSLWEPGYTEVVYLRVRNAGNLALKYGFGVNVVDEIGSVNQAGESFRLSDYIRFGMILSDGQPLYADRAAARAALSETQLINREFTRDLGALYPADNTQGLVSEQYVTLVVYMPEEVGNEANHAANAPVPMLKLGLSVAATQKTFESDSFGDDYDAPAPLPSFDFPQNNVHDSATVQVTPDAEGKLTAPATLQGFQAVAKVPAGVKLAAGATALTMTVSDKSQSDANITLEDAHSQRALDVHIEGVASDNTQPIPVILTDVAPVGMNLGNLVLYHVENGTTVPMTQVAVDADFTAHNQFKYDPATGELTLYMATFSEVSLVADTENAWNGNRDYTWYDASQSVLYIANADQLAGFGAIVGGMEGKTQDSFEGKTVKLICGINIGDTQDGNGLTFYPIGYNNNVGGYERIPEVDVISGFYAFCGTFDGNGQTIANFYQNTWEMFGDYNDGYAGKPNYFRDGMGLFGKVYGGTVKNLTVQNFQSDGEHTTTGVIAAYADSLPGQPALFENISILNCNPRVYNIGNGGIVGCAGWYSRNESLGTESYDNAVTFRNITVDQSNKISALWGSWGVSCAGILGQYYPNSACGIKMENCHVAAIIDVNNDVCSNYQYYWYRYAGMFIGTIRANTKDANGYTVADTTGVFAKDCTYTMGDWNEYWYCELVKNSLASYTHDHQFSRLDKISSVSDIQDAKGNWIKEGNFVIPNADNTGAECYHIFKNSDGELYQHFHDVEDETNPDVYETVNGETILKEDRQRYFIPFNQLLTGLDMGIKAHTEFPGISFVEDGTTQSVQKFTATDNNLIPENGTVTIGSLFTASGKGTISPATVQVYVAPVGDQSTVSATYSGNVADWDQGTLTFSGRGAANVVINDYYYCTSTTLPIYVLGGEYYIGGVRTKSPYYWYMTNSLGTADTKRYQAVDAQGVFPSVISESKADYTFELIPQGDNTFKIKTGEDYLAWSSGNSGTLTTEANADPVTVTYDAANQTFVISLSNTSSVRSLALNDTQGNNYFAWYGGTEKKNLVLIPVVTCPHSNTTTSSQASTCTEAGFTDRITCDDCLAILFAGNVVPAAHTYGDDSVCDICGFDNAATEYTYQFNKYTAGTQYAINEQHVLDQYITVSTTQCYFTDQLRIYSSTEHDGYAIIKATDGSTISGLRFNACNDKAGTQALNVYGSNDQGKTWTLIQGVSVATTTYKDYTADFCETDYQWLKLDVAGNLQMRLQSMTLSIHGTVTCTHTNAQNLEQAPTCTEAGYTGRKVCPDCNEVLSEGTVLPATGHTPGDDDVCDVCQLVLNGSWQLVTDASTLRAGDQIIIVNTGNTVALSTTQNNNNRGQVGITKNSTTVEINDSVQIMTLQTGTKSGTFAFHVGNGYLYAASSSNNYLRTETTMSDNSSWSIVITSSGSATIKSQGNYTRNTLRYNSSSKLFACYSSGQEDVLIYKFVIE